MTRLEQIEKLREKANVTYEEAAQALDTVDGDLLDAIIYLEKQGRVAPPVGGGKATSSGPSHFEQEQTEDGPEMKKVQRNSISEAIEKIGRFCVAVIDKGNNSFLEVIKDNDRKFRVPLTVLALLLIFLPYFTLPAVVIGLILGYRYRLTGSDWNADL